VLFGTLSVCALVRSARERRLAAQLRAQAVAAAIIVVASGGILVAASLDGYAGVPSRTAADVVANSARPLMYVVPGPLHPIFGSLTKPWIARHFGGPTGHPPSSAYYAAIYLGISLLLLAAAGAFWTVRAVWRRPGTLLGDGPVVAGLTALVIGCVAFAFAAPPDVRVLGLTVPMPYSVIDHFTTVFRVAVRFAVLEMLAACVLAGLALARLLGGRPRSVQWAAIALVCCVFAIDLSAIPSPRTTSLRVATIYQQLERQPPGIVAEYPLAEPYIAENEQALRPDMPQHPSFTGYDPGSASGSRKQELSFLTAPRTVPDLASYGVRYVIADEGDVPRPTPPGLQRVAVADGDVLYRVTAKLPRFVSYADPGFNVTEGNSPGVRWTAKNGAELGLWGACSPCDGTLKFGSGTYAQPRTLTVSDPSGNVLLQVLIRSASQEVALHVHFATQLRLIFRTDPPPIPINDESRSADTRSFGIFVAQPVRFLPDASNHWVGTGVRMTSAGAFGTS
jgi:hypothetical protein